jgi:predicted aldo/keto reductase-like oxidoreductase
MEMMKIPHTDLEVSRLAMGCMGLGGGWGSGTQLTVTTMDRSIFNGTQAAETTWLIRSCRPGQTLSRFASASWLRRFTAIQ